MRLSVRTYARIMEYLKEGGITAQDIVHLTDASLPTSRLFLKELHKRKLIYISGWHLMKNNRIKLPQYTLGEKQDVAKPKPLPKALITQRYKERQKRKQAFDPFFAICRMAVPGETNTL